MARNTKIDMKNTQIMPKRSDVAILHIHRAVLQKNSYFKLLFYKTAFDHVEKSSIGT